jgi:hypothetical protein
VEDFVFSKNLFISLVLLTVPAAAGANGSNDVAQVPVGASLPSIKLQRLKSVQVSTKQNKAPVPAYEVTYSFDAEPMASDEYGGRRFTFSVCFPEDSIDPALRTAIQDHGWKKVDMERYFQISTAEGPSGYIAVKVTPISPTKTAEK